MLPAIIPQRKYVHIIPFTVEITYFLGVLLGMFVIVEIYIIGICVLFVSYLTIVILNKFNKSKKLSRVIFNILVLFLM